MMVDDVKLAGLLQIMRDKGLHLRCAESCTAGGVMARVASIAGASDVLDRGWVVYSNAAKQEELGVPESIIAEHGAVSAEVVEALLASMQQPHSASLAISGIAGPSGGSAEKPVGTVWIAVVLQAGRGAYDVTQRTRCFHFAGQRTDIQTQAVDAALELLGECLDEAFA